MSFEPNGARAGADLEARFDALQSLGLKVGAVGLIASLLGALVDARTFFPSYLAAFLFWTSISLASIGLCFLHRLVGGGWALALRRPFEAAGSLIFLQILFFLPILLALGYTFPWADKAVLDADHLVAEKTKFLNASFFPLRAAIYCAIWGGGAYLGNAWSREQDGREDDAPSRRLGVVAGPALLFMFLSVSFAAFDWAMSRDPDWYSTIYGAMFVVGSILTTLSFMIAFTIRNAAHEPVRSALTVGRLNDVGNLLLAFTMLWAYMSFSQFLITWLGNLPEEVIWYLRRIQGVWGAIALGLIAFGFFAPFFALLQRTHKRDASWVLPIALWIVFMRTVDVFWLIVPGYAKVGESAVGFPWTGVLWYAAALAGIGGVWVFALVRRLRAAPLIPLRDPRILEVLARDHGHEPTGDAVL